MVRSRLAALLVFASLAPVAAVHAQDIQTKGVFHSQVRSWDGRTGQSQIGDNGTNLGQPGVRSDSGNPSNPE